MKIFLIAFLVCLLAFPASAAERRKTVATPVRHLDEACIVEASRMNGMPLAALTEFLLPRVAGQERLWITPTAHGMLAHFRSIPFMWMNFLKSASTLKPY